MSNPLPTIDPYGAADWKDYDHNWRQLDAEWLQSRGIIRYQTAAQRDSAIASGGLGGSPQVGQFVYNQTEDALEFRSKDNVWKPYRSLPVNTKTVTDTTSFVKLAHVSSGDKGITLSPTTVSVDLPFNVLGGALTADTTGLAIRSGTKTAKFTTDTTHLLSDTPLSVPAIKLTGTNPVLDATGKNAIIATLDVTTINATTITATGPLTGGVITGTSGTINGVIFNTGWVKADTGFVSQGGYLHGDASSALLRFRDPTTGTAGTGKIRITGTDVWIDDAYFRITNRGIPWHNSAGTHVAWISPVIYSATDPGAANYPDGTLWIS